MGALVLMIEVPLYSCVQSVCQNGVLVNPGLWRGPLPSEESTRLKVFRTLPDSHGHNLALTVSYAMFARQRMKKNAEKVRLALGVFVWLVPETEGALH